MGYQFLGDLQQISIEAQYQQHVSYMVVKKYMYLKLMLWVTLYQEIHYYSSLNQFLKIIDGKSPTTHTRKSLPKNNSHISAKTHIGSFSGHILDGRFSCKKKTDIYGMLVD